MEVALPMSVLESDSVLLTRLRRGDPEAFEVLVRLNGSWMLGLARRILGDDSEAEDVVQDASLSAFRSVHAFQGHAALSTWLHRIVVNASLMRLRSRRRRESLQAHLLCDAPRANRPPNGHDIGTDDGATYAAVRRAVEALPSDYRMVLLLHDVEGIPLLEVAELVSLSLSGTKSRLHRARQALRAALIHLLPQTTNAGRTVVRGGAAQPTA
jgi:RNA polymerase sigma-70 factor (ECF subfamily)